METGIMISIGALLISFIGLILNSRKDTRSDAAANASIQTKLDSVINGVTDIRVEIRTMRETVGNHGERLAAVEAKAENNAQRINALEGKTT